MTVKEIAYFNGNRLWVSGNSGETVGLLSTIAKEEPSTTCFLDLVFEEDDGKRQVRLNLVIPTRCHQAPCDAPEEYLFADIAEGKPYLLFAANRIFEVSDYGWDFNPLARSKMRVTVLTLRDALEPRELARQIQNLLAAASGERAPSRQMIPDDVKLAVWTRDGGACVLCQSLQELQFDHIIPFARGGGNSAENIQLLCQPCNLKKSNKIAI